MSVLARIARFLFWVLVVSWSVWLIRRAFGWMLRNAASSAQPGSGTTSPQETPVLARRLVRDPVCGMHVDETLAIPLREGGELVHFCSLACRDAYLGSTKKLAANG
jgi:YHS domain-containing protein